MIGIIAALPREVEALVRGVTPDGELKRRHVFVYRLPAALVACAGMGAERAGLAVRAALDAGASGCLVSTGLAGACDPALAVGTVVEASQIIDARSGERVLAEHGNAILVSSPGIANVQEKRRLRESYGASMVDMEAATVARLAQANGLRFRAIKAVSDAHDFELETLARFASEHGQFRTGAFALHTALHPQSWKSAMELGSGSQRALRALTEVLRQL